MTAKVTIKFDPGDDVLPEAVAVQKLQDALAALSRMSVDELAQLWRQALQARPSDTQSARLHHRHARTR